MKRLVGPNCKPPIGGMGGSIHDWERGSSPWHRSFFPDDLADQAPEQGVLIQGWYALDWCGNQIGFVADGSMMSNDAHLARRQPPPECDRSVEESQ